MLRYWELNDFVRAAMNVSADSPLVANLVGYWDLRDAATKMRRDYSGNEYHLSNPQSLGGQTGSRGTLFDGTDDYLAIAAGSSALLRPAIDTALTIAGSVKFIAAANSSLTYPVCGIWDGDAPSQGWLINRRPTSSGGELSFTYSADGSATTHLLGEVATIGTWLHFMARYDGANNKIFVNGVEDTAAYTGDIYRPAAVPFEVGRFLTGTGAYAYSNCLVDNLAIWNSALDDNARDEWYNNGTPLTFPFHAP